MNHQFDESFSPLERIAYLVTKHVGSVGFFLIIIVWSLIWLAWNTLAPRTIRLIPETRISAALSFFNEARSSATSFSLNPLDKRKSLTSSGVSTRGLSGSRME